MKITLTEVSPVVRRLEISLDAAEVERERDFTVRELARTVRIKGFRPGKVPRAMILARYKAQIEATVREELIKRGFQRAIEEKQLRPVSPPALESQSELTDQGFQVIFKLEVAPQIEVASYRGLAVDRLRPVVREADIERQLEILRQQHATIEPVSDHDLARRDDLAVLDVHAKQDGKEVIFNPEKPDDRELTIALNRENWAPGFEREVIGLKVGETKDFRLELPPKAEEEDAAPRTIAGQISLRGLKRRVVPNADDEFARDLGEYADLAALKVKIKEQLTEQRKGAAQRKMLDDLIRRLVETFPFTVPEGVVERQLEAMISDFVSRVLGPGEDPAKAGIDLNRVRGEWRERALFIVQRFFLLEDLLKREQLAVSDAEFDDHLKKLAERAGQPVAKLRAQLGKEDGLGQLRDELSAEKALAFLAEHATITEVDPPASAAPEAEDGETPATP